MVSATKVDRRKRHANDPTVPITVNIPLALRTALDTYVVAKGSTRSGIICLAIRKWLEEQENAE